MKVLFSGTVRNLEKEWKKRKFKVPSVGVCLLCKYQDTATWSFEHPKKEERSLEDMKANFKVTEMQEGIK